MSNSESNYKPPAKRARLRSYQEVVQELLCFHSTKRHGASLLCSSFGLGTDAGIGKTRGLDATIIDCGELLEKQRSREGSNMPGQCESLANLLGPHSAETTSKEVGSEGSSEPLEGSSAWHVSVAMQQDGIP